MKVKFSSYVYHRYTYRVLQAIQMKLKFLCVWAEPAVLGSAKTALKFKYEIQCMGHGISLKSERNNPWSNILLHTQSIVCATVEGQCLEYLLYITLP